MKELMEKNNLMAPKAGEIAEGKIIGKGRSAVFLDLGAVGTGIIYGREFYDAKDKLKGLKIGDTISVKITESENEDGYIELSVSGASKELALEDLEQKRGKDETIAVKILGANKGGLVAEISGFPAFLPVSQLSNEHYPKVEGGEKTKILMELQKLVGKELEVKILDISQRSGQIILSERAKEINKKMEALKNYNTGDEVDGEIIGLTEFGAFMKFGEDIEGLIHISELDWKMINDPAEVVKIGEKIKAKIIDISQGRVALSLKALKKDPWEGIEKIYKKGDVVSGKATKFNPFGVFIHLNSDIQGLCHISEFNEQKMEALLKIGQVYQFQILLVDEKEHKMSLKLANPKDEKLS